MNSKINGTHYLLRLLPLYLVIFIGFVGYSLMITVFTPLFLQGETKFLAAHAPMAHRTILLGIVLALYPLGQFFGSPIMGAFSDRFGRKPVLLISLGICMLGYIFIAISLTMQNLSLLMISLIISGLMEANIVIAQSAIADVSTPHDRNRLFGYIYLSASLAYILGPLIGGKLADPSLVSWFNETTPFWCIVILLALATIGMFIVFKETKTQSIQTISYLKAFTNLTGLFTKNKIRSLYLVNFLLYLAIFGFFRCFPMYLVTQFHMNVSTLSEYIAWVAVPIILANLWLTGFISNYFTPKQITFVSAILTGIFMWIILLPPNENALWITLFLASLALALCLPACASLLSMSANENEQGRVMGNNQALNVGAEALSGLIGGMLAALVIKLPLIILGFVALAAAIILYMRSTK